MNLHKLKKVMRAPKDGTLTRINAYLVEQYNKPIDYVQKPGHKPSSLGTDCLRRVYYEYFKLEKESGIDAKSAKIFEMGNYVEAMVMSWLKGIGEHIPYRNKGNGQIPLNRFTGKPDPQFPISVTDWRISKGYIDNVAIVDGNLWLYEIKSCAAHKFAALEEPMWDHKVQTACYFKAFNDHLAKGDYVHIKELEGVTRAVGVKFIYINKDNTEPKVFALLEDEVSQTVSSTEDKLKKAHKFIDLKELPAKTEGNCNYCPYQSRCQGDQNV